MPDVPTIHVDCAGKVSADHHFHTGAVGRSIYVLLLSGEQRKVVDDAGDLFFHVVGEIDQADDHYVPRIQVTTITKLTEA